MSTTTSDTGGGLRAWHLFLVVGLAASMAAVMMARDTRPHNLVMLSLIAFSAVVVGVAFHRTLLPFGQAEVETVETPALSARQRANLEREKMLVLRSIKELEFDRAMGKVADADFAEMVARLRARALGLMSKLDAEATSYRALVQRDLEARLAAELGEAVAPRGETPAPLRHDAALACAGCGTRNDRDARFCKSCGAKLDAYAVSM